MEKKDIAWQFKIPIIGGTLLTLTGLLLQSLVRINYFSSPESLDAKYIPLIFIIVGVTIVYSRLIKENKKKSDKVSISFLQRVVSILGLLIVVSAVINLVSLFLLGEYTNSTDFLIDAIILLMGIALLLSLYLAPGERLRILDKLIIKSAFFETEDETNNIDNKSKDNSEISDYNTAKLVSLDSTEAVFRISYNRLSKQEYSLKKQANVYLIIGCLISVGGLLALLYVIQLNSSGSVTTLLSKFNYFSRLSLVIFVEMLALFFLKLHKENIRNVKYYQNEMTNIELKYLALLCSKENAGVTDFSDIIKSFSSTERNFILNKGESTVDLELLKSDNSKLDSILKNITSIMDKAK